MTAETQAPRTEPMTLAQMGVRLQDYLRRELGRAALELSPIRSIAEGHSGFTYRCTAAEGDWSQGMVLRVPPPGQTPGAHRTSCARAASWLPCRPLVSRPPLIVANCADSSVLDGRPFCLMAAVSGMRVEKVALPVDHHRGHRRRRFALWEGKTRCEFTRLASRRDGDLQGLAWRRSVRRSPANAVVADADPGCGGVDRGCSEPRTP
jgi:hypothetical protein